MTSLKYSFILFITAAIWGFSFVAQRYGMDFVGPYTFNGVRFALGSLTLFPLYVYQRKRNRQTPLKKPSKFYLSSILLGLVLFIAASLQQIGMQYTTAANGGFITSLYVVLVPIFYLFLKKKVSLNIWIGAFIATIGLYLLSVKEGVAVNWGDILVLVSAIFWAIHVMLMGFFAPKLPIILLSIIQFATTSILSLIVAFAIESPDYTDMIAGAIPIIYGGVFSVGIAYTLQVFAQKKVPSEQAAIILSFESAFALLGGWLILSESHGWKSLFGAALMLLGIIISQVKWKNKRYER